MKISILYMTCLLIWGSTWFAITKQLGAVPVEISVAYRFLSAGILTLVLCRILKISLKFRFQDHIWFFFQGLFLYCLNYILTYMAEAQISSGLVALTFTLVVQLNIVGLRIFYGQPISKRAVLAAFMGAIGLFCLFFKDLFEVHKGANVLLGLELGLVGTLSASMGNMITVNIRSKGYSVLATNGWSMTYGGLLTAAIALGTGRNFVIDLSSPYLWSLFYLSVFGSVVAFWAYNTLIGLVGADRAAYVAITTPILALLISTFFESYEWGWMSLLGVALAIGGNYIMSPKKKRKLV